MERRALEAISPVDAEWDRRRIHWKFIKINTQKTSSGVDVIEGDFTVGFHRHLFPILKLKSFFFFLVTACF